MYTKNAHRLYACNTMHGFRHSLGREGGSQNSPVDKVKPHINSPIPVLDARKMNEDYHRSFIKAFYIKLGQCIKF